MDIVIEIIIHLQFVSSVNGHTYTTFSGDREFLRNIGLDSPDHEHFCVMYSNGTVYLSYCCYNSWSLGLKHDLL